MSPQAPPTVSVVIPTRNEADNLREVFARLPDGIDEIVLVDAGSTDGTVQTALSLRSDVRVVRQTSRGKGAGVRLGFEAARGDIIVMLDADGSTDPAEIPLFVDALRRGADFAKGSRFMYGAGSSDISPIRRLGNGALVGLVNLLYRTRYSDLCYGYNAFWRDRLPELDLRGSGFEIETMMNVHVAQAGLTVAEVPSSEWPRVHGRSHLHAIRDGVRVLRTIVRERVRGRQRARPPGSSASGSGAP